jgi:NitT/TauT family transport system ATP-binding protein
LLDTRLSRMFMARSLLCQAEMRRLNTDDPARGGNGGWRMPDYLVIDGLSKQFGAHGRAACTDISLSIGQKEFVALIGPSGCGKSTLLHITAGLSAPTSGTIRLKGQTVSEPRPEMMYVFQQYTKSIFPWKTVLENVCLGIKYRSQGSRAEIADVARQQLKVVGLASYADYYPYQLSGGMQQRVAIARALARQPEILLMDEPFSALDAMMRVELQDLLLYLWRDVGLTILFVTHDLDEALYVAQRVVMMSASPGRIAEVVDVPLPYPRNQVETRRDPTYLELRSHLYNSMVQQVTAARAVAS